MFDESDEPVRVAVGIIKKDDTYLICQRGINRRYGLKWEFPGGKLFPDESAVECLTRELEEELGIVPTKYEELSTNLTTYPDGGNFLITYFLVTEYSGDIINRVFEKLEWVRTPEFQQYDLLEGTKPAFLHL